MKPALYVGLILTALTLVSAIRAQTPVEPYLDEQYSAPVVWTQYKIPTQNLSIAMPKLPVVQVTSNECFETVGATYTAYAEQAVYEFAWHAKSDKPVPESCRSKEQFSQKQYLSRMEELRKLNLVVESDTKIMNNSAKMFRSEFPSSVTTHWLLWDIDRWFEITIVKRKDSNISEERFLASMSASDSKAVEIGPGSWRILGDRLTEPIKPASSSDPTEGIVICSKPRPGYTDLARNKNTQGTVVLRVTFLRNGGIGPITVVKALPYGLTEQAIAAAQRVSFLPVRTNGSTWTVAKQIEYSFLIF